MDATLWMFAKGSNVLKLQQLLNKNNAMPKLVEDGDFGRNTYNAVTIFQRINGLNDDGIVGPKTWRKLGVQDPVMSSPSSSSAGSSSTVDGSNSATTGSNGPIAVTNEGFCFPFPRLPGQSWLNGGRQFGAPRDRGARRHAGCDLIFPEGTLIYAVADGVRVHDQWPFYSGTSAVSIRHGNILVRYGEIANGSYIGGASVTKGQVIAKVGRLDSGRSMLHLEIYTNAASSAELSIRGERGGLYRRRVDLTNPAPYLDVWKNNLPNP